MEFDTASTVATGGEVIGSGYVAASTQTRASLSGTFFSKIALARGIVPTTFDTITVVAAGVAGNANAAASITVREIY
jgi:hypothetical protein